MSRVNDPDGGEPARLQIWSLLIAQGGGMSRCLQQFSKMNWTSTTSVHIVYTQALKVFKVTPTNCSIVFNVGHLVHALITSPTVVKGDTGLFGIEKFGLGAMHSRSVKLVGYLLKHGNYDINFYNKNDSPISFDLDGNTFTMAALQVLGTISMFSVVASGNEMENALSLCSNMRKVIRGNETRELLTPFLVAISSKNRITKYYEALDRTTSLGEVQGNFELKYNESRIGNHYAVRQNVRNAATGKMQLVTVHNATTFEEARDWMLTQVITQLQPYYEYLEVLDEYLEGFGMVGAIELMESSNIDWSDPLYWCNHVSMLPGMKDPRLYDYETGKLLAETGNVRYQPSATKGIIWKNVARAGGDSPFGVIVEKARLAAAASKAKKRKRGEE